MNSTVLAVIVMLISTFTYSIGFVLQHKGSQGSSETPQDSGALKDLVKNKFWWIGTILFLVAGGIHIVALSLGSVAIVQPLLVTELIFIPPLSAVISKVKVSGREWMVILVVSVALAIFLITASPQAGTDIPSGAKFAATTLVFAVIVAALFLIGSRMGPGGKAASFGTAAAFINAWYVLSVAGALDLLPTPLGWAMAFCALVGIVGGIAAATMAFKAGPITFSTPAIITVNPVVATVASMWLYGDSITDTPIAIGIIAVCVVVIVWGVIQLSRAEAEVVSHDEFVEPPLP